MKNTQYILKIHSEKDKEYFLRTLGAVRSIYNYCIDLYFFEGTTPTVEIVDKFCSKLPKVFSFTALSAAKRYAMDLFYDDYRKSNGFTNTEFNKVDKIKLTKNDLNEIKFFRKNNHFNLCRNGMFNVTNRKNLHENFRININFTKTKVKFYSGEELKYPDINVCETITIKYDRKERLFLIKFD